MAQDASVGETPLSLHVPEPEVRPGGTPDFSNVPIPKAGSVPRPPVDVDAKDIRDLAYSIIRVLNRDGESRRPLGRYAERRPSCWRACAT